MTEKHSDIGTFIREQREQAALSVRKLADKAGVSNPYLSQIERGLRNPSAEILKSIANGLSISAETLYARAGLLDGEPNQTPVEMAIATDERLDDAQREELLAHYHRMVRAESTQKDDSDD